MAAIDFPNSPSVNDVFDVAGKKWLYDGSSWNLIAVAVTAGVTSLNGNTGVITGIATLASPTFTGTPTLPTGTIATTQTAGNNTTAVATTAFVATAVSTGLITSSATAPVSPSAGNLWFDTSTGASFIYYNSAWVELGGGTMSPYQATSSTRPSSPWTGQHVYETDTSLELVYNSSAWVCITPQSSSDTTSRTSTATSYTTLTGAPAVTVSTGTKALITVTAELSSSVAGYARAGVVVSGASTIAAAANKSATSYFGASTLGNNITVSYTYMETGLTAGSNTFTMQVISPGSTLTIVNKSLTVVGIP